MMHKFYVLLLVFCSVLLGSAGYVIDAVARETDGLLYIPDLENQDAVADGGAFILNDTLYYVGGWQGDLGSPNEKLFSLSLTNPDEWVVDEDAGIGRFGIGVTVYDRRAYVVGGYDGNFSEQVDVFDPNTNLWTSFTKGVPRHFAAVVASNGYLYMAGGIPFSDQIWRMEIGSSSEMQSNWTADDHKLEEQLIGAELIAYQNCLYFIGGKSSNGQPHKTIYASSLRENGSLGGWFPITPDLEQPLAFHGATVHRNTLYVVGGETSSGVSDKIYSIPLDGASCGFAAEKWETFATLPNGGLQRMGVASRWGELYIVGGKSADGLYTNAVMRYVLPTPDASMALHKSVTPAGGVGYGAYLTYTLHYTNTWAREQHNVVINDKPEGTVAAAEVFSWPLGTLEPGASGAVSFTVRTLVSPTWDFEVDQVFTLRPEISGTKIQYPQALYTLRYTPTAELKAGLLFTDTLPPYLRVSNLTTDFDVQDYAVAVHALAAREQVVVRILPRAEITRPGTIQLSACVAQPFTASTELVNEITFNDSYWVRSHTLTETAKPGSTIIISASQGCTRAFTPSESLPPLYPAVHVINTATISSTALKAPVISNRVANAWPALIWPVYRVYLPVMIRQ